MTSASNTERVEAKSTSRAYWKGYSDGINDYEVGEQLRHAFRLERIAKLLGADSANATAVKAIMAVAESIRKEASSGGATRAPKLMLGEVANG